MNKKLLIIAVALVLCISVIGGSFALYHIAATDEVINISTQAGISLTIGHTQEIGVDGLSPAKTSGTFNVELQCSVLSIEDESVKGRFYITVGQGELAEAITISASVSKQNASPQEVTHANLTDSNIGYECKLTELPETVTLTFALTQYAVDNFRDYADKELTVTLNWVIVEGSAWEYDANAYYLIGSMNGWTIDSDEYKFEKNNDAEVLAAGKVEYMLLGVELAAGTELKVKKGETWLANLNGDFDVATGDGWSNIEINDDGTYNIYYCEVQGETNTSVGIWIEKVTPQP